MQQSGTLDARSTTAENVLQLTDELRRLGNILGLLQANPDAWLHGQADCDGMGDHDIRALLDERSQARKQRDFAKADHIRRRLEQAGIILEDTPTGDTLWRRS